MGLEMNSFAMDGHQHFRLHPVVEPTQFLAAWMAGDVDQSVTLGDHFDTLVDQQVLDVDHFALVTGNGPGREDHAIAGIEVDHRVLAARDPSDGGARFAL